MQKQVPRVWATDVRKNVIITVALWTLSLQALCQQTITYTEGDFQYKGGAKTYYVDSVKVAGWMYFEDQGFTVPVNSPVTGYARVSIKYAAKIGHPNSVYKAVLKVPQRNYFIDFKDTDGNWAVLDTVVKLKAGADSIGFYARGESWAPYVAEITVTLPQAPEQASELEPQQTEPQSAIEPGTKWEIIIVDREKWSVDLVIEEVEEDHFYGYVKWYENKNTDKIFAAKESVSGIYTDSDQSVIFEGKKIENQKIYDMRLKSYTKIYDMRLKSYTAKISDDGNEMDGKLKDSLNILEWKAQRFPKLLPPPPTAVSNKEKPQPQAPAVIPDSISTATDTPQQTATAIDQDSHLIAEMRTAIKPEPKSAEETKICKDSRAEYPGGLSARNKYLEQKLRRHESDSEGIVEVAFVVDTAGEVTDVKVNKSLSFECDNAASDAVSEMPKWNPAVKNCIKVSDTLILPFSFKFPVSAKKTGNSARANRNAALSAENKDKLILDGTDIWLNDSLKSEEQVLAIMRGQNSQAAQLYQNWLDLRKKGKNHLIAGAILLPVGAILMPVGYNVAYDSEKHERRSTNETGVFLFVMGLATSVFGGVELIQAPIDYYESRKKIKESVSIYNSALPQTLSRSSDIHLNIGFTQNGPGIVLTF